MNSSRQEAIANGELLYLPVEPCPKGHVSVRHVKEGCVECKKIRNAAYRTEFSEKCRASDAAYRAANRDKLRAKDRAYYQRNVQSMKEKSANWRARNGERMKELAAAWRREHPERMTASRRKWNAANPHKNRIYRQNRRRLEGQSGKKISSDAVPRLYKLQKGRCACCGKKLGTKFHLDHIMPLALGGSHEDSNLQLLTQRCNNQKRAKHPVDFMRERGFLL